MGAPASVYAIVLDVDWAPDFVIDETAKLLKRLEVHASWFVTHASPAIERLKTDAGFFEIGIHPNFLEGSSHGSTIQEVINYCLKIAPEAVSMRTHAYWQSSHLYGYISKATAITNDASVFMPLVRDLRPAKYWIGNRAIHRIPVFWEDDNEMKRPTPDLNFLPSKFKRPGLKVFAFHPLLLYLNANTTQAYSALKAKYKNFAELNSENIRPYINQDAPGVRDFFADLVGYVHQLDHFYWIKEIPAIYKL